MASIRLDLQADPTGNLYKIRLNHEFDIKAAKEMTYLYCPEVGYSDSRHKKMVTHYTVTTRYPKDKAIKIKDEINQLAQELQTAYQVSRTHILTQV